MAKDELAYVDRRAKEIEKMLSKDSKQERRREFLYVWFFPFTIGLPLLVPVIGGSIATVLSSQSIASKIVIITLLLTLWSGAIGVITAYNGDEVVPGRRREYKQNREANG